MKQYLIVLALALPLPTMALSKDASCTAFGFKATTSELSKMNKEAKTMKSFVPMMLNESFGDIQTCVISAIEHTLAISDGRSTIVQSLRSMVTSFTPRGSYKPSKCLSAQLQPYSPKQGKC
ncbi:hypothetical protein N8Z32_03025 [Ascidiaceihabitans sp.]|nr:hypothetical protein [Ascidiaceihabitans sp.]